MGPQKMGPYYELAACSGVTFVPVYESSCTDSVATALGGLPATSGGLPFFLFSQLSRVAISEKWPHEACCWPARQA